MSSREAPGPGDRAGRIPDATTRHRRPMRALPSHQTALPEGERAARVCEGGDRATEGRARGRIARHAAPSGGEGRDHLRTGGQR